MCSQALFMCPPCALSVFAASFLCLPCALMIPQVTNPNLWPSPRPGWIDRFGFLCFFEASDEDKNEYKSSTKQIATCRLGGWVGGWVVVVVVAVDGLVAQLSKL